MPSIILIAHNLRSCHNVGSLLRTADGLGIDQVFLTGYTPYPSLENDERLPHIALKVNNQIQKTSLGAELLPFWNYVQDVIKVIKNLSQNDYVICGLEQAAGSLDITKWKAPDKLAIIIGRETLGIEANILKLCDTLLEIPMFGSKESFNVVQAAAMALYHCKFVN